MSDAATSTRRRAHRPSARRRREALLDAAVEIAGESGAGAVTHRAVAARAGLPLATTSYFFGSITELLAEALKAATARRAAELDGLARELAGHTDPEEMAHRFAKLLLSRDRVAELAEIESYLSSARAPELKNAVREVSSAYERVAESALRAVDAADPQGAAPAFKALSDGFVLSHLACPRPDDEQRLAQGLLALFRGHS